VSQDSPFSSKRRACLWAKGARPKALGKNKREANVREKIQDGDRGLAMRHLVRDQASSCRFVRPSALVLMTRTKRRESTALDVKKRCRHNVYT
jgi:hypothetical protein